MKPLAILCVLFAVTGFTASSQGPANLNDCQKENEYLRKALKITTPVKSITSSKIDFNLLKVEGNAREQSVEITLTLVNHDVNKEIRFNGVKAIDVEANEYASSSSNIKVGSGDYRQQIYTDTPVKTVIKINKVLPSVKMFKLLPISYEMTTDYKNIEIEFKDIPIEWK